MLGWLALIIAALTGLLLLIQTPVDAGEPLTLFAAVGGMLATLATGYFIASNSNSTKDRWRGFAIVGVVLCILGAGALWVGRDRLVTTIGAKPASTDEGPRRVSSAAPVSVLVRRNAEGSFVAQGQISGIEAAFLVDTGASAVMLKPTDAERSGIDIQHLNFTTPVETANGTVYTAPVRVRSISIGLLKVEDVEALVARPGSLNENLLGMSFLRRLTSYDMAGDFLTLRN
jgi:aspartyl protease family protein